MSFFLVTSGSRLSVSTPDLVCRFPTSMNVRRTHLEESRNIDRRAALHLIVNSSKPLRVLSPAIVDLQLAKTPRLLIRFPGAC
jgi:hypothetical protein